MLFLDIALRDEEAKLRLLLEEGSKIGGATPELTDEEKELLKAIGSDSDVAPYDPDAEVGVARQHIEPVQGFLCKVCRVFVLSSDTADVHCL